MAIDKGRRLMEIVGVGTGGGQLAKLRINYEDPPKPWGTIEALFNPNELIFSQNIKWEERETDVHNVAISGRSHDYRSTGPRSLSLQLFFDTYEQHNNGLTGKHLTNLLPTLPFSGKEASDVRKYTAQVVELASVNKELHRPPICQLFWGRGSDFTGEPLFTGVLTELAQTFSLFLPDGTPVRAKLDCTFTSYQSETFARASERHSADVAKSRIVKRGESLHTIAAEEYNDPGQWRHIARANGIINPRRLTPGTKLLIPSLT